MLQKCMLTIDPSQVRHLLDRLGEGHDQDVLEWLDKLTDSLKSQFKAGVAMPYLLPCKTHIHSIHPLLLCSMTITTIHLILISKPFYIY